MDSVLSQVLSASTGSFTSAASNGVNQSGGKKEYVPPSLALLGKTPTLSTGPGSTPGPSMTALARTTSRGNTGPKVPSRPPSRAGVASPTPTDASGGGGIGATGGTSLADIRNVYVSMSLFTSLFRQIEFSWQVASSRDLEQEFTKMEKQFEVVFTPAFKNFTLIRSFRVRRRNTIGRPGSKRSTLSGGWLRAVTCSSVIMTPSWHI